MAMTSSSILLLLLSGLSSKSHAFTVSATGSSAACSQSTLFAAKDTPIDLPSFSDAEEYLAYMEGVSSLPLGFATGSGKGTFISKEAPSLGKLPIRATVIQLTEGATESWAACFTSNMFPGAPVKVGRKRLAEGQKIAALVINNKVSNVCSGGDGEADAELVCDAVASSLNLESGKVVLPSSTGVIGWRLPAQELAAEVVPDAIQNMQTKSVLNAAKAIMTTDRFPKVRSKTLSNGARIVGIAKGAGMIEPNMATMLSYILTDASVEKKDLQRILSTTVDESFNCLSIDGDESTSDTIVALSSNQIPDNVDLEEFEAAFQEVCRGLARDMVRNGEGTGHVMKVQIDNFAGTKRSARFLGRHIVNSPLFKCAVAGNDPNTGRLAAAIGSYVGKYMPGADVSTMSLTLGGRVIFENGKFALEGDAVEKELSQHMKDAEFGDSTDYPPHQRFVEIGVDFGDAGGDMSVTVFGSDLTKEYVEINADYRS
eukprot:scaffold25921_cov137-Cylindrotheca_fusiformis.AAC.5